MLNMGYCRTENVIAALREWVDHPGSDEELHSSLNGLCLLVANDAGLVPNLSAVIQWLENGCDPKEAAKELRLYQSAMESAMTANTHYAQKGRVTPTHNEAGK